MDALEHPAAEPIETRRGGRYDRLFRPGFVHRDLYVDPAVFAAEMRHLFGSTWVYLGHESEIPAPFDYVARRIGRRPVVLSRTGDGAIAGFVNRCTHRGALVCRHARGNARSFTCGYHAWAFGIDGRCIGIPLKHAYASDFRLSDASLMPLPRLEAYRGFVFASMNPDVPDLETHLAGARPMLDQWIDRDTGAPVEVRAGAMLFETHANWKTIYDNAGDGYHPPFSHTSMLRVFARRYGDVDMQYYRSNFDESPLLSKDLGNGHTMLDQRPAMHAESAWGRQHVIPGREILEADLVAEHGRERAIQLLDASTGSGMNLNIFPNLLIIGNQIQLVEPIAVDKTVIHWFSTTLEGVPDGVNAARMRMQEDFPSFGEVDDTAHFESCQQGLETVPEMEWVNVGRHELTDVGRVDADGLWREPISSDLHLRSYYAAWHRIMNAADPGGPDARLQG